MEAGREETEWGAAPEAPVEDQWRAGVYSLLAGLLADPPDRGTLARMAAAGEPPTGEEEDGPVGRARRELAWAAAEADPEAVDDEYHDLFIGLGRGELVPFASWYRTGLLMDKPLVLLRRDLAALGIQRQAGNPQPEDHAAALCEVMGLLAADGEPPEQQRTFFAEHLGPWLGRFFEDLQAAKRADFYRGVGRLGAAFMAIETEYLQMPA